MRLFFNYFETFLLSQALSVPLQIGFWGYVWTFIILILHKNLNMREVDSKNDQFTETSLVGVFEDFVSRIPDVVVFYWMLVKTSFVA